jgi:hypothetical protein
MRAETLISLSAKCRGPRRFVPTRTFHIVANLWVASRLFLHCNVDTDVVADNQGTLV